MSIPVCFVLIVNILLVKVQISFFLRRKTEKDNKAKYILYCLSSNLTWLIVFNFLLLRINITKCHYCVFKLHLKGLWFNLMLRVIIKQKCIIYSLSCRLHLYDLLSLDNTMRIFLKILRWLNFHFWMIINFKKWYNLI